MTTKSVTVTYTIEEPADGSLPKFAANIDMDNEILHLDDWNLAEEIAREALIPLYREYDNLQEVAAEMTDQHSNTATADTLTPADLDDLEDLHTALVGASTLGTYENLLRKLPVDQFQGYGRDLIDALDTIDANADYLGIFIEDARATMKACH